MVERNALEWNEVIVWRTHRRTVGHTFEIELESQHHRLDIATQKLLTLKKKNAKTNFVTTYRMQHHNKSMVVTSRIDEIVPKNGFLFMDKDGNTT